MQVKFLSIFVAAIMVLAIPVQSMAKDGLFIVRQIDKMPEVFVQSVEDYAKKKDWNYLGASKVKKGEITLVKCCITEVGKQLWQQGLYLSAMAPCGNIGVYRKEGETEISVLNPRYMNILAPSPEMEKISVLAETQMLEMLDEIAK